MPPSPRDHYLEINQELKPLRFYDIPFHPSFGENVADHPPLSQFVERVFRDAQAWNPRDPIKWKKNGRNTKIKAGDRTTDIDQFVTSKNDKWFARYNVFQKGVHDQYWDELDYVLRQNHSEHEENYTPDVFDRNMMLKWDEDWTGAETLSGMKDISMEIVQMFHEISGVTNRYFNILVLTGIRDDHLLDEQSLYNMARQFIVVQLPVDLSNFPKSIKDLSKTTAEHVYDPTRVPNPENVARASLKPVRKDIEGKKLVQGYYASVEQVSRMDIAPDSIKTPPEGTKPYISWCMSTASNAGGHIPRFLYGFSVPDKIAQDVKYVTDYIAIKRGTPGWPVIPRRD